MKALTNGDVSSFGRVPEADLFQTALFRKGTALTAAFAAFLATQTPRALVKGDAVDTGRALSAYNRKEFHHIFPQAYLAKSNPTPLHTSVLANICFLPSEQNKNIRDDPPSEYFGRLQKEHGEAAWSAILTSNLIDPKARDAAESDDYAGFIEARAEHLATVIEDAC